MNKILSIAKETLEAEADSIRAGAACLEKDFEKTIELFASCKGRIIVTGIGKSAAIANKIVATLNSTGSPAIFLHAAEAVHGDLGVLLKDDMVLCISNSGNSPEIKKLIPFIKSRKNQIIAICGNTDSFLALNSNYVIDATVEKEAYSFLDAPTSSTTLQLALGDAIAVCLAHVKGFSNEDFAKSHPGGTLGKKLSLKIGDFLAENHQPAVDKDANLTEVIYEISSNRLGATVVVDKGGVVGIITDGDIRRMLENQLPIKEVTAQDIMSKEPKKVEDSVLAADVFRMMNDNNISQVIVKSGGDYKGIVHIHDLVKEGLAD